MGGAGHDKACESVMCRNAVHQRPTQADFAVRSGACEGSGWRRSAVRTGLHTISLLTGNFTGNFGIPGL